MLSYAQKDAMALAAETPKVSYTFSFGDVSDLSDMEFDNLCNSVTKEFSGEQPEKLESRRRSISITLNLVFGSVTITVEADTCEEAAREAVRSAQKFKNQIVKGDLPLI